VQGWPPVSMTGPQINTYDTGVEGEAGNIDTTCDAPSVNQPVEQEKRRVVLGFETFMLSIDRVMAPDSLCRY
jgi:hypothetical protein